MDKRSAQSSSSSEPTSPSFSSQAHQQGQHPGTETSTREPLSLQKSISHDEPSLHKTARLESLSGHIDSPAFARPRLGSSVGGHVESPAFGLPEPHTTKASYEWEPQEFKRYEPHPRRKSWSHPHGTGMTGTHGTDGGLNETSFTQDPGSQLYHGHVHVGKWNRPW